MVLDFFSTDEDEASPPKATRDQAPSADISKVVTTPGKELTSLYLMSQSAVWVSCSHSIIAVLIFNFSITCVAHSHLSMY